MRGNCCCGEKQYCEEKQGVVRRSMGCIKGEKEAVRRIRGCKEKQGVRGETGVVSRNRGCEENQGL